MTWLIDDIPLSTLAYNIVDRSAGWKVPAKRGDNLIIPGRHGAQFVPNKPFEVGSIVLSMWAVGALEDGSIPSGGTRKQVRENLDKLTALFAQSHKLLSVVQMTSTAYGVQNFFINPAFSNAQQDTASTYSNLIPNPSCRLQETAPQVSNLFPNPSFRKLKQGTNPSRVNLAPNPNYEYGTIDPAIASSFATVEWNDTVNPNGVGGILITPNGTGTESGVYPLGDAQAAWDYLDAVPGDTFTISAYSFQPVLQTGTLSSVARRITIGFRDAATGSQSFALYNSAPVPNVVGTNVRQYVTFTVPQGINGINIRFMNGSNNPSETFYWDGVLIERSDTLNPWFTGDTPNTETNLYAWEGTPGASASTLTYTQSKLNIPIGYGNFYGGYTLADKTWSNRIAAQVALVNNSGTDIFFPVELHEENDMHKYFLNQLKAVNIDWALAEGDGGNQCLYKASKFTLVKVTNYGYAASRSMSVFTFKEKSSGLIFNGINTHFRADDNDGTSRAAERAGEAQELMTYINTHNLPNVFFVGDFNSGTTSAGYPRAIFAANKWFTLKQRTTVANGQYSTYNGTLNGAWIEDIYTRNDLTVSNAAEILTNGASDHYAWLKATIGFDVNSSLGFSRTFENLVLDPYAKYLRQAPIVVATHSNYYFPANFENFDGGDAVSSTYWTTAANTAATVQNNGVSDQSANPNGGLRVFRVLSSAALAANASLGSRPPLAFNSTDKALFRCRMRRSQNTSTVRTIQVQMVTCSSTGTVDSAGTWQTFTLPATSTGWTDIVYDSTALANNTSTYNYVQINFRTGEAWTSGDGIVADCFVVNSKASKGRTAGYWDTVSGAGPFFDGDSQWIDTYYSTANNANTASRWDTIQDNRWLPATATGANSAYWAWAQTPKSDPNGTILSFHAMGFQIGGTQQFTMECAQPAFPGQPYTVRFGARGLTGTTCTVELLKRGSAEVNPTVIGSTSIVGQGTATNSLNGFAMGDFINYAGTVYTPAEGDRIYVRVTVPVTLSGTSILQFSSLHVTNHQFNFYGDTTDTANSVNSWEGTKHNSKSFVSQRKVMRIDSNRQSAITTIIPTGYIAPVTTVECFCMFNGENPYLSTDPQPLTRRSGVYFSADALGSTYPDVTTLGSSTTVQVVAAVQFLDANNNLLSTVSGTTQTLNQQSSSLAAKNLTVSVLGENIPAAATQIRGRLTMVNSFRGTGFYATRFMLLDEPLAPTHLGRAAFFDGSTGTGYSWSGDVDDSASRYLGNIPKSWNVINGGYILRPNVNEFAAKGAPQADGKPKLIVSIPLADVASSGDHLFGVEVMGGSYSSATATVNSNITAQIQILNNGAVLNTFSIGRIYGAQNFFKRMQGLIKATNSFNEVRLIFTSDVVAQSLYIRIPRFYLFPGNSVNPLQKRGTNLVNNARFLDGTNLWGTATNATVLTTDGEPSSVRLGVGGTLTTNRFTVAAGITLRIAIMAKIQVNCSIKYYNSAGTLLTTSSLGMITQTEFKDYTYKTIVTPASTASAEVSFTSVNDKTEIKMIYVAENFTGHEDDGFYDPLIFPYFDGSLPDYYDSPTEWTGEQDNSTSVVVPAVPVGWVYTANGSNVHQVGPGIRPPGSNGTVGGLLRITSGTTKTYRTTGVFRNNNGFLSGQIALSAMAGVTVKVEIYQADDATSTGSVIWTKNLTNNDGQILIWNDLAMTKNYVYLQITYSETKNAPGYRVWFDNLSMLMTVNALADQYPGYFDGNQGGGGWLGDANGSVSQYLGGGRRAYAEVREAIDMSSMAGGTRAEFVVAMEIPGSFWEDLVLSNLTFDVTNGQLILGKEESLDALVGTTAPIDDAIIKIDVTGSVENFTIQDVATQGWLKINGILPSSFTIDNGAFTVIDSSGSSLITKVTRGGSNQLVPLVPVSSVTAPRLKFSAGPDSTGKISVTVVARRRYVIA